MTTTPPSPSPPRPGSSASSATTMTTTTTGAHHSQSQNSPSVAGPVQKPSPPPVDILSTPFARTYAHVHPALLLALYALRFPSMMADPVSEMMTQVPLLAVAQVVYVVTCLPAKGTVAASTSTAGDSGAEGSEKRAVSGSHGSAGTGTVKPIRAGCRRKHLSHGKRDGVWSRLTPALLSLTLTFLLGTPILAILLVLFGAPLTTHTPHTILCAMHMSLLSATALIYVHGVDGAVWKEVYGFARPSDAVWGGALGTGVGAWLGAIPIPLDWDRPWQAYPITILTGAYLGFAVGSLIGRTPLLFGKRLAFTAPEDEQHEKSN